MSDERKEILKMLAEGKINADEAERLLLALEAGTRRRDGHGFRETGARVVGGTVGSIRDVVASIGPAVKTAMGEVLSELSALGFDIGAVEEEDTEEVDLSGGSFKLAKGDRLVIINDKKRTKGSPGLILEGVKGDVCKVEDDDAEGLKVYKGASKCVIRWTGGPLKVYVPQVAAAVTARTLGGDVKVSNVNNPFTVKTLGGNLDLSGVKEDFRAKTMGGDIKLELLATWHGEGNASTMGGSIEAVLPSDISASVKAVTMGGSIEVDEGLGRLKSSHPMPGSSVKVRLGEGEPGSRLSLKTMGGNIALRKAGHE